MKRLFATMGFLVLIVSQMVFAAAAAKYQGTINVAPKGPHGGGGITGTIQLMFDGDTFTSVVVTPNKPVFGNSSFTSSEQAVYSETLNNAADMVVTFKLVGPPHPWRFVLVTSTTDQGKTFPMGVLYAANEAADAVKKDLDSGSIPSSWTKIGSVVLSATGN